MLVEPKAALAGATAETPAVFRASMVAFNTEGIASSPCRWDLEVIVASGREVDWQAVHETSADN